MPPRQRAIDEAARAAGRDPASIRRIANVSGRIADGEVTGWLEGPVEHWVEELGRLVRDYGFDGFVVSVDADAPDQIERLGGEVAPAVRLAVGAQSA